MCAAYLCILTAVLCFVKNSRNWIAAAVCRRGDSAQTLQVKLQPEETQTFFPACISFSPPLPTCRQACTRTVTRSVGHKGAVQIGEGKPETPRVISATAWDQSELTHTNTHTRQLCRSAHQHTFKSIKLNPGR